MEINKIYNENCIDTMARMPDGFVDLTVTSPPYDNLRTYTGETVWNEDVWKDIIKELYRVTKPGGVVVWVVGDSTIKGSETGTSFKQALCAMECGFNLHDTMIYAKNNPIPLTHNRYEQQFEYMFIWSKGKPEKFNAIKQPCKTAGSKNNHKSEKHYENSHSMRKRDGEVVVKAEKYLYNIWFLTTGTSDKVKHNAPFPEKLANDHILSWSNENDLVYDPFMGSGTTAKMAILNKRNWVGSEISKEYCEIAEKRTAKKRINENL
jgi:DNA modification methylase